MPDFLLPDLGEGLAEAEIVSWLVSVGDEVAVDQVVVEVETAKASVEVPVPFAGTVSALHGAAGERVPVGSPLITVEPATTSTPAVPDAPAGGHSGTVLIGYGTSTAPTRRGRVRRGTAPLAAPTAAPAGAAQVRSVISPVVRKLARDRGIDLRAVIASDPSGVIRRRDVENASVTTAGQELAASALAPRQDRAPTGAGDLIPFTGVRRTVAERLSRSRREIPEATVWVDADATGLLDARRALNTARPDQPVSVLALLARFCVAGLLRYRELNSRITEDGVLLLPGINLGFAAQTDRGLMVPVVREAQRLSTRELATQLGERTEAARTGRLAPADLVGGTFTVNNYGVFGVDGSAAIINYPEVAILGMGRIVERPWVVDGALAVRKVTQLTLSFDHRACDGGVAGGFLRFVADCVENPLTLLGEL
jgi:2-oxoisovalerate dehydrogenase E2 component (dihydrolipoyl transacylase)